MNDAHRFEPLLAGRARACTRAWLRRAPCGGVACRRLAWLMALAIASRADVGLCQAEPDKQQGVLVLANGQVLAGHVTHTGDHYDLVWERGEARLRADQVAFSGPDLEAAYRWQKKRLGASPAARIELAHWCLRCGLLDQAAAELSAARGLDPGHPRLMQVELEFERATALQAAPAAAAARQRQPLVASSEVARRVRLLPEATVEAFRRTVEPTLLARCATAGCHDARSDRPLRLLEHAGGKQRTRLMSDRNLYSVLNAIDERQPADSPLLTQTAGPHGPSGADPLDEEEFAQLRAWVLATSGSQVAQRPARLSHDRKPLLQQLNVAGQTATPAQQVAGRAAVRTTIRGENARSTDDAAGQGASGGASVAPEGSDRAATSEATAGFVEHEQPSGFEGDERQLAAPFDRGIDPRNAEPDGGLHEPAVRGMPRSRSASARQNTAAGAAAANGIRAAARAMAAAEPAIPAVDPFDPEVFNRRFFPSDR